MTKLRRMVPIRRIFPVSSKFTVSPILALIIQMDMTTNSEKVEDTPLELSSINATLEVYEISRDTTPGEKCGIVARASWKFRKY